MEDAMRWGVIAACLAAVCSIGRPVQAQNWLINPSWQICY
jgi:hypothetical protein